MECAERMAEGAALLGRQPPLGEAMPSMGLAFRCWQWPPILSRAPNAVGVGAVPLMLQRGESVFGVLSGMGLAVLVQRQSASALCCCPVDSEEKGFQTG